MAGKKELVRGGLASVFGGLDKNQETEPAPQGVEAPLILSGPLDSTKHPALQNADSGVAERQDAGTSNPIPAAAKTKKEAETMTAPQAPERSTNARNPLSQLQDENRDPYAHVRRVKWPLLEASDPYIVPGPEGFESLNATINFRLPANLDATLDAHCRSVGARKSAWIREAILKFLAEEQVALEKLQQKG
ncbi:hypothetical protein A2G06_16565 (plasmid) [Geobacter anodireducens]|nr:hypothetical protein A2G06_16565 [Geobacter anodireducens]